MKNISGRLHRLEERIAPQPDQRTQRIAEMLRELTQVSLGELRVAGHYLRILYIMPDGSLVHLWAFGTAPQMTIFTRHSRQAATSSLSGSDGP